LGDEPTLFGKYTLLEVLGEGAMARVYRAIRSGPMGFQKEVALKLIHPQIASQEKGLRALINEARMGGLLSHRNVVEIHEFDQIGDTFYIAMELVRGWSLAQVLARSVSRGPLPPRIVTEIAAQICEGLAHAHGAKDPEGMRLDLVHRDLKPTNVMLAESGVVKLADFGIARAATNVIRTSAGITKGTPCYMSPEQVRGKALDARSDLFSLASLMAEMITGQVVFHDIKIYRVLQQVARADVTAVLGDVEIAMPEIVPILRRGFQRMPADRHVDAVRMGREIEDLHEILPGREKLRDWLPRFMGSPEHDPITAEELPPDTWDDWASSRMSVSLGEPLLDETDAASVSLGPIAGKVRPPTPIPDLSEATTEEAPWAEFVGFSDESEGLEAEAEAESGAGTESETGTGDDPSRVTLEASPRPRPTPPPSRRGLRYVLVAIGALMALAAVAAWVSRVLGS
jgi:serine/threonine protein kinase